jgi:predicted TIM-barrel fold metal-dependent hydrolase
MTLDALRVIDSDTHVEETEQTWDFMAPEEAALRPTTGFPRNADPSRPAVRYWLVDRHRRPRPTRDDVAVGTRVEARELLDIDVRLRHMDELGVETHVMYPTLFLAEPAEHAEAELAWTRSYNRWLAERCARSHGRLRWVCIPPLRNMDAALEELRFAKDHGACGILKKGDLEAGKWPADPYNYPLYAEAERLDMPICFHLGSGIPEFESSAVFSYGRFMRVSLSTINGIHSLIAHDVPKRFPSLRVGCIEAGASWVPYVKYDLLRLAERRAEATSLSGLKFEARDDIFSANRIYVTCQVDEDLPYVIGQMGDDNLLVGSDYSHQDPSKELGFVRKLRERAESGEISEETVRKIVYANPKKFYGL